MSANSQLERARADLQEVAHIFRKTTGWWSCGEFSTFAKEGLVELNAIRARRGDFVKVSELSHSAMKCDGLR